MERTIYSKYSNERAKRFCIRTDITVDDGGERKVYKHALTPEGRAHIAQIAASGRKLDEAYRADKITFCPCTANQEGAEADYAAFPFLTGITLQDVIKKLADSGDNKTLEKILTEYIRRLGESGGNEPFVATQEFEEVLGALTEADRKILAAAGRTANVSAKVSDVDMILSNLFVESDGTDITGAKWQVIDYEWTFDFPIPKGFLIYRGLYFAYYQVLYHTEWGLKRLLAMADIDEEEAHIYQRMEECFQKYLAAGALPVRNMQRALGTEVVTLEKLLAGQAGADGVAAVPEAEWLHVKKIQYHIDRNEYQDGSYICSGWAFAATWDGRCLPVNIEVQDEMGAQVPMEVHRRERRDVMEALKLKRVSRPQWGFDCVWIAPPDETWRLRLSLGRKNASIAVGRVDKDVR